MENVIVDIFCFVVVLGGYVFAISMIGFFVEWLITGNETNN
jgi:hypothetical protein